MTQLSTTTIKAMRIKDDSPYKCPEVILLDEKHWSYIRRRYGISPRELEVAKLVCRGFSNKEIAKSLKIKDDTVKTHLRNIYRRIRVKNKVTLLLRFIYDVSKLFNGSNNAALIPIMDEEKYTPQNTSST